MADEAYLNELMVQETDPVARALLEQFAKILRDQNVNAVDYPLRVRTIMDLLFRELTNALNHANRP
jgi:hypothetical protein